MSRAEHLYHRIMVGLLFTLLALPLLATLLYAGYSPVAEWCYSSRTTVHKAVWPVKAVPAG